MNRQWSFGKRGLVSLDGFDKKGAVELNCCAPCCLFQAVLPTLCAYGVVDNLKISEPVTVWMPQITGDMVPEHFSRVQKSAHELMNRSIKNSISDITRVFSEASQVLGNVHQLVPMLPLGVYVDFRFRVYELNIVNTIVDIQKLQVDGISEFQWSIASALAEVLNSPSESASLSP